MKSWIKEVNFKEISREMPCGFSGFITVEGLIKAENREGAAGMSDGVKIPEKIGVYLILAPKKSMPHFNLGEKTGFRNNNEAPRPIETLQEQWVDGTPVIYIGKAGVLHGKGASNLNTRLKSYLKWYTGDKNRHHGGRDIWQIDEPGKLVVAWRVTDDEDPRSCEKDLLAQFVEEFKRLPFANHQS